MARTLPPFHLLRHFPSFRPSIHSFLTGEWMMRFLYWFTLERIFRKFLHISWTERISWTKKWEQLHRSPENFRGNVKGGREASGWLSTRYSARWVKLLQGCQKGGEESFYWSNFGYISSLLCSRFFCHTSKRYTFAGRRCIINSRKKNYSTLRIVISCPHFFYLPFLFLPSFPCLRYLPFHPLPILCSLTSHHLQHQIGPAHRICSWIPISPSSSHI